MTGNNGRHNTTFTARPAIGPLRWGRFEI
ncbi:unnamed protein product, partial [Rotaria sp. Silwood2]